MCVPKLVHKAAHKIAKIEKLLERIYNPITQWGFRQCLLFSWTTLRGKHCGHPIAVVVVDTLRPLVAAMSIAASVSREGKRGCFWVDLIAGMSQPKGGGGPGGHGRSVNPLQTRGEGADFSPRS